MTLASNPARMRFPIYSYFSAQTAYHDAHRGRGRGKIGHNTFIETNVSGGGGYSIILHRTPIVTYRPDGSIVLNSGGYRTVTTKARMNEVLPDSIRVYQQRHDWFVTTPWDRRPFHDGMVIQQEGGVQSVRNSPEEQRGGVHVDIHSHNPPRIIYRAGQGRSGPLVKVYRHPETDEYEVVHERSRIGEGYFTTDKQDAIDTAKRIVHDEKRDFTRRNPGKFSSPLDEYVYQLSLDGGNEELGDVQGFGYYARLDSITFEDVVRAATDVGEDEHSARKAWEREFKGTQLRFKDFIPAAILHEDSQGFVGVTYFTSDRDADKAWDKLVEEYEEWEAESGEE